MARGKEKDAVNRPFDALRKLRDEMAAAARPAPLAARKAATPVAGPAKAPAPPPARKAPLSDAELFLQEVGSIAQMDRRAGRVAAPPPEPAPRPAKSDDAEVLAALADLCGGDGPFDISDSDEYIEGLADGIDRRLLKRLRAGEYAVQAHLDLHGLTRDEARERVAKFLVESRRAGRRCVLLVHGRGLHSKDQIPVLKQAVRSWLERGQIARSVLAFATARPVDGGAGAVYVLLRR